MSKPKIILCLQNVRSAHNVGSLMRTSEGLGIEHVYLCGYTPYPHSPGDKRLPHVGRAASAQIHKTALGAEELIDWSHQSDILKLLAELQEQNYQILALEQTPKALSILDFKLKRHVVLVVGNEVKGLDPRVLKQAEIHLQIPMVGHKESFNVAVAAGIALYHLRYKV